MFICILKIWTIAPRYLIYFVLVSTYQSQLIGALVAFCILLGAAIGNFTMKWYIICWKHNCIHYATMGQPLNNVFFSLLGLRNTKRNNKWRINQKLLQNRDTTYTQMKLWTLNIKSLANSRNLFMIQFNNNLSYLSNDYLLKMVVYTFQIKKNQDYEQGHEFC